MSSKVTIGFDKYLTYPELTEYLHKTVDAYPNLASLESAGKSYEGREVWALTLTNRATGRDCNKPAIYVDGNIHAGEVTGCMVAVYLIDYLVDSYGKDEEVTHLLDTRAFYVLPRVNPDGAELYLTTPAMLRSSVRHWPEPDEDVDELPGLNRMDVNGDGKILQMRVRDDRRGEWKVSKKDVRLMVPRRPGEWKGPFYHVYPEGVVKGPDASSASGATSAEGAGPAGGAPVSVSVQRGPFGLDLNRNFPSNWDTKVPGGGDFPTGEPEARAIVEFIVKHPNIGAVQALHTSGGFFYRNPCQYPDDKMDPDDFRAVKEIAREGTLVTGYPDVKSPNRATLTEWAYEHKGMIAYTTELWNRFGRAGIDLVEYQRTTDPDKREDQNVKLLAWNDRELAGRGFHDWMPFDHPQFGPVEIGGWEPKYCLQNPPPQFLKQECHRNAQWIMRHAGALPEIHITGLTVEDVDGRVKKVSAVVENFGYLPTCVTNKAKALGAAKKDVAELLPGEGVTVVGQAKQEVDFLEGYMNALVQYGERPAKSAVKVTWVVRVAGNGSNGDGDGDANGNGDGDAAASAAPNRAAPACAAPRFTVQYTSQRAGTDSREYVFATSPCCRNGRNLLG